jgi:hypothetical protein
MEWNHCCKNWTGPNLEMALLVLALSWSMEHAILKSEAIIIGLQGTIPTGYKWFDEASHLFQFG